MKLEQTNNHENNIKAFEKQVAVLTEENCFGMKKHSLRLMIMTKKRKETKYCR